MVYHRSFWNTFNLGGLFHGVLKGQLFKGRSLHEIIQDSTDGTLARYYTIPEWHEALGPDLTVQSTKVFGSRSQSCPYSDGGDQGTAHEGDSGPDWKNCDQPAVLRVHGHYGRDSAVAETKKFRTGLLFRSSDGAHRPEFQSGQPMQVDAIETVDERYPHTTLPWYFGVRRRRHIPLMPRAGLVDQMDISRHRGVLHEDSRLPSNQDLPLTLGTIEQSHAAAPHKIEVRFDRLPGHLLHGHDVYGSIELPA
jgi:hypothetical protein